MIFNRDWGRTELIFIALFGILYLIYLGRTFWYAHRLNTSARSVALKFFLRSAAMGALVIGLLEPSFGDPERDVQAVGKDIFLVVDVSSSMDATDIQPSRLQRIKFELNRLITQFPNDRFGLIVFSSGTYLQCPLTFDRNALTVFIESLNTRMLTDQGTAFEPALQMALDKQSGEHTRANASKVIVFISDGEDFNGVATKTLRSIRRQGIQLFCLGIGTREGSRIPSGNGFIKGEDGTFVRTYLQSESLEKMAATTGGDYYEITTVRNDFPQLTQSIQQVAGRLIDQRKIAITSNRYYYFVILGLVLLSLDILITVRTFRL
ncbi:aerotolerance regulator BatB [Siphonobacter sp. BAB-5385]|uniref:vWA domain-containing protein n=1 Tax=Siphonobacter sp. BAB-5385 TaxID=1864822 RepID=UPI000B9E971C|nr:VWA domain-containing protein [Siphonobacter sp. BAB-5385]OZI05212.1 aerotolerance regulator BatB [Siphonobacter sp. BAB-5385]